MCVRTWECVCVADRGRGPCAFCAVSSQVALVRGKFGNQAGLPLFPSENGSVVSKEVVVDTIEAIATRLREPLRDSFGRARFGGHTMRVSGAQWLRELV